MNSLLKQLEIAKPTMDYVAFDPGESTGIAAWCDNHSLPTVVGLEVNEEELDTFLDLLESYIPKIFIIEEYRVFNDKFNHQGDKVQTAQVIGNLKGWARRHSVQVIEQRPDCRVPAAAWAGVTLPRGHMPDWQSAFLHGYFYLYNNDIIKESRVLKERRPLGAKEIT